MYSSQFIDIYMNNEQNVSLQLPDDACRGNLPVKPSTFESCNVQECPKWITREWSGVSIMLFPCFPSFYLTHNLLYFVLVIQPISPYNHNIALHLIKKKRKCGNRSPISVCSSFYYVCIILVRLCLNFKLLVTNTELTSSVECVLE